MSKLDDAIVLIRNRGNDIRVATHAEKLFAAKQVKTTYCKHDKHKHKQVADHFCVECYMCNGKVMSAAQVIKFAYKYNTKISQKYHKHVPSIEHD